MYAYSDDIIIIISIAGYNNCIDANERTKRGRWRNRLNNKYYHGNSVAIELLRWCLSVLGALSKIPNVMPAQMLLL